MKFSDLNLSKNTNPKRVGRGISAGRGKTAGRGTKGQGSRKSGGVRPGFEGGQMPLYMRIPKLRGFRSRRPLIANVTTSQLNKLSKTSVDNESLAEAGLVENPHIKVKVIHDGELSKKLNVKLQSASSNAIIAIEKAGGSFSNTKQIKRPAKKVK